ncbi:MAG: bifunctional adenosylcobinamide kinase/adenosylcobinamide-phosphate guanylyltransferase [Gloeomargaritaceae cyanobacterium C42_A2020_066]|nr:bifunctional adenosylcobinamide kinase/adenosylcobinamide-phosphate guanylyltransferase [Gloeomargaritaceae cyanobacterium C42_A2020_066]
MGEVIVVAGPARSGKSAWAEYLACQSGRPVIYVATAQSDPQDLEWQARIEAHRQRRPAAWVTLEAPLELGDVVRQLAPDHCLLVDSLGTWVAAYLEEPETAWNGRVDDLVAALNQTSGLVVLVAEEVGWGMVPAYPVGRLFRDRLGSLVQRVARPAGRVYLVTTGYVLDLTQVGIPLPSASREDTACTDKNPTGERD